HALSFSYVGVRSKTRTQYIGQTLSGNTVTESLSSTTELSDRQGRLTSVTEPSGTNGGTVSTSYGYDLFDHLSSVSTTSGTTTQQRIFTYDNRGLLVSE